MAAVTSRAMKQEKSTGKRGDSDGCYENAPVRNADHTQKQQESCKDSGQFRGAARQTQSILQHHDRPQAQQASANDAAATKKVCPTKHDRCNRREFVAGSRIGFRLAEMSDVNHPCQARCYSRNHIDKPPPRPPEFRRGARRFPKIQSPIARVR